MSKNGSPISHLAFAYDLILFAEASLEQVHQICNILSLFCKYQMIFLKNVGINHRNQLSEEMGIQWTNDLGKYLGVPIFHNKVSRGTFQFIMDKVHQTLSAWKTRTLSFAGAVA